MLLAGRAQVHVRVDEGREQVAARAVDDLGAVGRRVERAGGADLGDLAVADEDVVRAVEARARVEHVGAAHEQVGGAGGRADEAHAERGDRRGVGRGRSCELGLGRPRRGRSSRAPASTS